MGDADETYNELVAPVEGQMIRTIARLVRDPDDAADVLQDALAAVWKNRRRILRHANPHAYVIRVCTSKAYDALRKRRRRRKREAPLDENSVRDQTAESAGGEIGVEEILDAIARLPARQARVVLLRLLHDSSFAEIAETLGCAEATARSHFSKGKARLRKTLSPNDDERGKQP